MISLTQTDMAIPSEPYSAMQAAMAGASSGRHSRGQSSLSLKNKFNWINKCKEPVLNYQIYHQ